MSGRTLYELHLEFPLMLIFACVVTALAFALLALWSCLSSLLDHLALQSAWQAGEVQTAEGQVADYLYERRPNGICQEQFAVGDVRFCYKEWGYFPGYFRCCGSIFAGKTGVISGNGQHLRITYVPDWPYEDGTVNAIVRIEELSD